MQRLRAWMTTDPRYEDYTDWVDARRRGRFDHVCDRAIRCGLPTGIALASLCVLGWFGEDVHDVARMACEAAFFVAGSIVATGTSAWLEWVHLERAFSKRRVSR